jgi:hypothetical protein
MAVATFEWFGKALINAFGGETAGETVAVDYLTDTMKIALLNALPNKDTAEFFSDVSATEVTGTNWATKGQTLASKTIVYTAGTDSLAFDAADVSVASVTVTGVTHLIIFKDTGTNSTSPVLWFATLDGPVSTSNGTLQIVFDSAGIAVINT